MNDWPDMPAWAEDVDGDSKLPEDAAIKAVFPTCSGRHDLYAEAMRLVGAKRSKGALVDLVNWLLHRAEHDPPATTFVQRIRLRDLATGEEFGPSMMLSVSADADFPGNPDSFSSQLGFFVGGILARDPNKTFSVNSTIEPWPMPAEWKRNEQ